MANINNIVAGLLAFLICASMSYVLWTPVNNWLSTFPTSFYVLAVTSWIAFVVFVTVWVPAMMAVSDDTGN